MSTRRALLRFLARAATLAPLIPFLAQPARATVKLAGPDPESLPALIRDLFPHRGLDDAFYRDIAVAVRARLDAAANARINAGLEALDRAAGNRWSTIPAEARRAQLLSIEKEPYFQEVYGTAIELVYRDPRVWAEIGYGGNALAQGGYLTRGFNDIDWLPADRP
jgi:hypothetical protein